MKAKPRILGICASLRNARKGKGNQSLVADLQGLDSKEALFEYLGGQAKLHVDNFMEAGKANSVPFDQLYSNLRKQKGDRGLSNSEIALSAALWSCVQTGAEIDFLTLNEFFFESGAEKNLELLKEKLMAADGVVVATPVYFGDRSSPAQSLLNVIKRDSGLKRALANKFYAGVSVGAKRNGGQETTLIYQMWDFMQCGFLGVGNDSETTSQYGGTGHAGDIGTMQKDTYGLETAMGTGRRIARVAAMKRLAQGRALKDRPRVAFMILQDKGQRAERYVKDLVSQPWFEGEADVLKISNNRIFRCLACDVCPTHIDLDENYRCIIKSSNDDVSELHPELLEADVLIPVVYSAKSWEGMETNYQEFLERTRYLRRGDYVLSDLLVLPLIIEELGAEENYPLRVCTALLRHHTVLAQPLHVYTQDDQALNWENVADRYRGMQSLMESLTVGRLEAYATSVDHLKYKPVGYVLSAYKDKEDEKMVRRHQMIENRISRTQDKRDKRVERPAQGSTPAVSPEAEAGQFINETL